MIDNKYPALRQLFSGYLHQDWSEEFGSPDMAIDAFAESEPTESIKKAMQELKIIIDSDYRDNEVLNLLNELGCYYEPTVDYTSVMSWIKDIKKKLS